MLAGLRENQPHATIGIQLSLHAKALTEHVLCGFRVHRWLRIAARRRSYLAAASMPRSPARYSGTPMRSRSTGTRMWRPRYTARRRM